MICTIAFVAVALAGCGSSKPTVDVRLADMRIGAAQSSVTKAERLGARDYSSMELRTAVQKLEAARAALKQGDNALALRLAEQAQVDADLAEITALTKKSEAAVKEIRDAIEALREEMQRQ
jgi:hypothetical protein